MNLRYSRAISERISNRRNRVQFYLYVQEESLFGKKYKISNIYNWFAEIMTINLRVGHFELLRSSDFDSDIYFIETKLATYDFTINHKGCWLYNQNLNRDGYPRIRYSIPDDYRVWDDGHDIQFTARHRVNPVRKLRDYRIYLHRYLYWKDKPGLLVNQEISHLCGESRYGNSDHLFGEYHLANLARQRMSFRDKYKLSPYSCMHIMNYQTNILMLRFRVI